MSDIEPRLPLSGRAVTDALGRLAGGLLRRRNFWFVVAGALLLWIVPASCTTYVPPNMVGVKQAYYGDSAGIRKDIYGPGTHFVAGGVERLHLFPHDLQVVNFSESPSEASKGTRAAGSIKIQTSDGYNVQLDVTVIYRITDAHQVFVEAGPGRAFEDRLVIPRADRILRKTSASSTAKSSTRARSASKNRTSPTSGS